MTDEVSVCTWSQFTVQFLKVKTERESNNFFYSDLKYKIIMLI